MKQYNNVVMSGASGALGRQLVFKQYAGKTVICMPALQRKDPPSPLQLESRNRFAAACRYARTALANPRVKAAYQARSTPAVRAYNLAVGDFLNAPQIVAIDTGAYSGRPGDAIAVYAVDDFGVRQVFVTIQGTNGGIVEEGVAAAQAGGRWVYIATAANAVLAGCRVVVQARDLPGNTATGTAVL